MAESVSQKNNDDFYVSVAVFSDSVTGKTNLVTRFVSDIFKVGSKATIVPEDHVKSLTVDNQNVRCMICDTLGLSHSRTFLPLSYLGRDGCLVIFDLTRRQSFDEISTIIAELRQDTFFNQSIVLVGNKSDLTTQRQVTYEESINLAQKFNIPYIETSALSNTNIKEAFIMLIGNILKQKQKIMLKLFTNISSKELNSNKEMVTVAKTLLYVMCKKSGDVFTCRGCLHDFCARHATRHQGMLAEELDDVIRNYNRLHKMTIDRLTEFNQHPFLTQIDEWETQSIAIIRRIADETRQEILHIANEHLNLTEKLKELTQQLNQARREFDFSETELNGWIKQLELLKDKVIILGKIKIEQISDTNSLIPKMLVQSISPYRFEQSTNGIKTDENGLVIVQELSNIHGVAQGGDDLSWGKYRIRFHLEKFHSDKWNFVGIVSKNTPLQPISIHTPTAYGWNGNSGDYLNGELCSNLIPFRSDFKMNDLLELQVDCDKRIIRLINYRTNRTREHIINIDQCPLPWQFRICLVSMGDCIRLQPQT